MTDLEQLLSAFRHDTDVELHATAEAVASRPEPEETP